MQNNIIKINECKNNDLRGRDMYLESDLLNDMRRGILSGQAINKIGLSNSILLEGEKLKVFCTCLSKCKKLSFDVVNNKICLHMEFRGIELDEETRKEINQDIWRYDCLRKEYDPVAHIFNAFLSNENYNQNIYNKKVKLTDKQYNLINGTVNALPHFGFKVEDNECFLALDKMTTSESLVSKQIGLLAKIISKLDFIHIIPFYKHNGNDVKEIRILMGYKKEIRKE